MRPWKLSETNYGYVKQNGYEVAVLPLGATEPHNLHLPYGTDTLESDVIGGQVCEEAHRRGAKVVLLPTLPYGTETNQREFPLSMNVNPSTLGRVITDLVDSLVNHGIRKILLLNSHGGNDLKPVLRELYGRAPAHLFLCNWYRMLADVEHEIFDEPGDHAGEMETSLALAFFPELVARKPDGSLWADEGATAETRFEAVVVQDGAPWCGRAICEVDVEAETGLRIIAILDAAAGRAEIRPGPATRLTPGTVLLVVGSAARVGRLADLVGAWE